MQLFFGLTPERCYFYQIAASCQPQKWLPRVAAKQEQTAWASGKGPAPQKHRAALLHRVLRQLKPFHLKESVGYKDHEQLGKLRQRRLTLDKTVLLAKL